MYVNIEIQIKFQGKSIENVCVIKNMFTLVHETLAWPEVFFSMVTFSLSPIFFSTFPVGLRLRSRSGGSGGTEGNQKKNREKQTQFCSIILSGASF